MYILTVAPGSIFAATSLSSTGRRAENLPVRDMRRTGRKPLSTGRFSFRLCIYTALDAATWIHFTGRTTSRAILRVLQVKRSFSIGRLAQRSSARYCTQKATPCNMQGVAFIWRCRPDLNWCITVLQTVALPLGYGTKDEKSRRHKSGGSKKWSGLRGSNSLPPPWQGGALPDELKPHGCHKTHFLPSETARAFGAYI